MPVDRVRKFKGYAALDERGNLLWGSFRIRREDAECYFHAVNPAPPDHDRDPRIVPVTILMDDTRI